MRLIKEGWPDRVSNVRDDLKDTVKDSLSTCEGLITPGCRIVIPQFVRQEILEGIHEGHMSLPKCREYCCKRHCVVPQDFHWH